jgi:hypothetical protein
MKEDFAFALLSLRIQYLKAILAANQMEIKALEQHYEAGDLSEQERSAVVNRWNTARQDADATRLKLERLQKQGSGNAAGSRWLPNH